MAEALKLVYSEPFIDNLLQCWSGVLTNLNQSQIKSFILSDHWEQLELKERMSRLSDAMGLMLSTDFEAAAPWLYKMVDALEKNTFPKRGYEYMFIPDYVEKKGLNHVETSLPLLARITQFVSSEFAIRPFIIQNEKSVMNQMLEWSKNEDKDIRRLSSEGCRSRLPWAMALPYFKKDASLILPILENLKADDSLYVRKSVANNLNDISKDHPELALQLAYKWKGKNEKTDWLVKHAMRTLLKAGNAEAMKLFGYSDTKDLKFSGFNILTPEVEFGNALEFRFKLKNNTQQESMVRFEYAIYFMKQNGSLSKKVFKISERNLQPTEELEVRKNHWLKAISTRKYYPGKHELRIIINGIEFDKQFFLLNM